MKNRSRAFKIVQGKIIESEPSQVPENIAGWQFA